MLTLIVPGKHQVKNMDVYIAPFIEEMQLLWKAIRMYDISRPPSNRPFVCYGVLCWTIHDSQDLVFVQVRQIIFSRHTLFPAQPS